MAKIEQALSIFLASPSDVSDERNRVGEFIDEWNNLWSDYIGVHLRLLRWETHAYPSVGVDGQDVINAQIGEEYDIFVGLMWKRFGTPTGRAASGTVEEFDRALSRYRLTGAPQILFYFKKADAEIGDDLVQLEAVQNFRKSVIQTGLLYREFINPEQFGQLVRIHLTRHIQDWVKRYRKTTEVNHAIKDDGANRFKECLETIKRHSIVLVAIVGQYARGHLEFITETSQRAAKVRAMADEQLTIEFMVASTAEAAASMERYADANEKFETDYAAEFSSFIESVLTAAAMSLAFPAAHTGSLRKVLVTIREKLQGLYVTTRNYSAQLLLLKPKLTGGMAVSNERSVGAMTRLRANLKFGERMLYEAEKLFKINR